jgi:hypothetical protein
MQQMTVLKAATTIAKSLAQVIRANLNPTAGSYTGNGFIDPRNLYFSNLMYVFTVDLKENKV